MSTNAIPNLWGFESVECTETDTHRIVEMLDANGTVVHRGEYPLTTEQLAERRRRQRHDRLVSALRAARTMILDMRRDSSDIAAGYVLEQIDAALSGETN